MFRICSEFSAMFRICSEFSVMFRICSEFSAIFRICTEFSAMFKIFSKFWVIFRISSTKTGLFRISWLCSERRKWSQYYQSGYAGDTCFFVFFRKVYSLTKPSMLCHCIIHAMQVLDQDVTSNLSCAKKMYDFPCL